MVKERHSWGSKLETLIGVVRDAFWLNFVVAVNDWMQHAKVCDGTERRENRCYWIKTRSDCSSCQSLVSPGQTAVATARESRKERLTINERASRGGTKMGRVMSWRSVDFGFRAEGRMLCVALPFSALGVSGLCPLLCAFLGSYRLDA